MFQQAQIEIPAGHSTITSANIRDMFGDNTGYVHVQSQQTFYISYSQYITRATAPPVNLLLDHGGVLWASPDLRIVGADDPAFRFEGHLAGVYNLTLEAGKVVMVGEGATNNLESDVPFDAVTG